MLGPYDNFCKKANGINTYDVFWYPQLAALAKQLAAETILLHRSGILPKRWPGYQKNTDDS